MLPFDYFFLGLFEKNSCLNKNKCRSFNAAHKLPLSGANEEEKVGKKGRKGGKIKWEEKAIISFSLGGRQSYKCY